MEKKLSILGVLFLFLFSSNAQITFQKTYGGAKAEVSIGGVYPIEDNGYLIVGTTESFGAGRSDFYLIKTDASGSITWTKTFGGPLEDVAVSAALVNDGGYIVSGQIRNLNDDNWDICLVKTDSSGNMEWSKTIDAFTPESGWSIHQTSDGGFVTASGLILIKLDFSGNLLWAKQYSGGDYTNNNTYVQQTSDHGFILAGHTNGEDFSDICLIKTDSLGNLQWAKTYGGTYDDVCEHIVQTEDGGYIVCGLTYSFSNEENLYIIKTDDSGNLSWSKTYASGNNFGWRIRQLKDGTYIVIGASSIYSPYAYTNVYLLKLKSSGDTLWTRSIGSQKIGTYSYGYDVNLANDNGFIISGNTMNTGYDSSDIYLIKTDLLGNGGCYTFSPKVLVSSPPTKVSNIFPTTTVISPVISSPFMQVSTGGNLNTLCYDNHPPATNKLPKILVFPNPLSSSATISFAIRQPGTIFLAIYDGLGRRIKVLANGSYRSGNNIITWNVDHLSAGIYFLTMQTGSSITTKKLTVVR